ncbi:hypothetical protein BC941DRAFT_421048 [Chlamydoabsidia padenii]|nr:hypothetical protein BC941DRAFT_421048 [Chlamydoabsidia padenii]
MTTTTIISHAKASANLLDLVAAMDKYTTNSTNDDDDDDYTKGSMTGLDDQSNTSDINDNDTDEDPVEQEQFKRISGILTQLIQEANNAIHNTTPSISTVQTTTTTTAAATTAIASQVMDHQMTLKHAMDSMDKSTAAINTLLPDDLSVYSTPSTSKNNDMSAIKESRRRSRLPRPTKSVSSEHAPYLNRTSSSTSSMTSSMNDDEDDDEDLFSSISSTLTTPMSRTISPLLFETQVNDPVLECTEQDAVQYDLVNDPLLASFERLDSSLAIVDSLSRDLANYRRQHPRSKMLTSHQKPSSLPTTTNDSAESNVSSSTSPTPSFIKSNNNNMYAAFGWTHLLMLSFVYIPYIFILSLWEELVKVVSSSPSFVSFVKTTTHDPHVLFSRIAVIEIVSPTIGLIVFVILLMILHLLRAAVKPH